MLRTNMADMYKISQEVGGDPYELLKLGYGPKYSYNEVHSAFRKAALEVHTDKGKEKNSSAFIRLTKARDFLSANPKGNLGAKLRAYENMRAAGEKAAKASKAMQANMEKNKGKVTWDKYFLQQKTTWLSNKGKATEETKVAPEEKAVTPTEEPQIEREKKKQTTRIQKENTDPDPDRKTPVSPKKKKGEERKKKVKTLALEIEKMTTNLGVMADQLGVLKTKILELEAE